MSSYDETDYQEWMKANYPGYLELDSFSNLKPRYANTPFESVYEDDEEDFESSPEARTSSASSEAGSLDDLSDNGSGHSYLLFDFDDNELLHSVEPPSSLDDAFPYLPHYDEEGDIPISLWFDDNDTVDSSHSYSDSEDDEVYTPKENDTAAIMELRESLRRSVIYDANPLAHDMDNCLAPLEEPLRLSPVDCFADVCWEQHPKLVIHAATPTETPVSPVGIDVPEEALHPEWETYSVSSPSEDIALSPPRLEPPIKTNGFKRFAKHLRIDAFSRKRLSTGSS